MGTRIKRLIYTFILLLLTVPIAGGAWLQGMILSTVQPVVVEPVSQSETTEPATEAPKADSLVIYTPESESITVKEPFVKISGVCDVTLPLTVNGQAVETAADGSFAYDCPLTPGENAVTVTNTDKTFTYKVVYEQQLLRSVSPSKAVKGDGGMLLELSAVAIADAQVTAKLAGTTVTLTPVEDSADDTGFQTYVGTYTLPAGKYEKQSLGKLKFTAVLGDQSQSMNGASVTVNALQYEEIPIDVGQGAVKAPVVSGDGLVEVLSPETDFGRGRAHILRVTEDYAETCPGNTADDKSSPLCTPFLKGTYDYVTGQAVFDGTEYYITKSGYKVEKAFSESFDGFVLPSNTISVHKSYTEADTTAILTMNWKVPFVSELKEQRYVRGYAGREFNVTAFTASYIDFKFYYTNAAEGSFDFSGSNVVSRAEWVNIGTDGATTLRVYLKRSGKFYGYRAYYSNDNRLVLSFQNAPKSLSNAVVAIDPGHGGKDSGAIGANGVYESALNLRISALLKQKLEAQGVRVVIFRTGDTTMELDERQQRAREAGADVFVCMHNNSSASSSMSGTEVYYYRAFSKPLAASIHAQLVTAWQGIYANDAYMRGRIVPSDGGVRFYPFRTTRIEECPAVLVECGYLSNATECSAICQPANQERIAEAVCRGVTEYLNSQ